MDFIYEEDVPLAEVGQRPDQVARLLESGTGGCAAGDAELSGDQLSESCLAETWRAEEERVVEGLSPLHRGVDVDAQGFFHAVLADEFGQALRAEGELDYALLRHDLRSSYFCSGHLGFDGVLLACISER